MKKLLLFTLLCASWSAANANVIVTNNTTSPLTVSFPETTKPPVAVDVGKITSIIVPSGATNVVIKNSKQDTVTIEPTDQPIRIKYSTPAK